MAARFSRAVGAVAALAGRAVRSLTGVAALGCGFAGAWLVWGLGVALLVAAGFLLVEAVTS